MTPASHTLSHHRVTLYTRAGCHLCDTAYAQLVKRGLSPQLVDIDSSPALRSQFDTCVPVIEINGRIRFRGRINAVLLERILSSESP